MPKRNISRKIFNRFSERNYYSKINEFCNSFFNLEKDLHSIPSIIDFDFHSRNRIIRTLSKDDYNLIFFDLENRKTNTVLTQDLVNLVSYGFDFNDSSKFSFALDAIDEYKHFFSEYGNSILEIQSNDNIPESLTDTLNPFLPELSNLSDDDFSLALSLSFISRALSFYYSLDGTELDYMRKDLISNALIYMDNIGNKIPSSNLNDFSEMENTLIKLHSYLK